MARKSRPPLLGRPAALPASPAAAQLDRVPNPHPGTPYAARFTFPEFTALCPVTGQPDWGMLVIRYRGRPIDREGLLRYIVSFRKHNEFHEQCVERIYCDLQHQCAPEALAVYARYTRRGGLDINPFRSSGEFSPPANIREIRQ